jgi:predicted phage terminase large subunit-like protein
MDIEKLKKFEKLPPDVKRQLAIYMAKWKDKKKQADIKNDFMAFVKHVWPDFVEGRHHKEVAEKFNQIAQGKTKRVIINMAPRHTKSEFASYLLPAWMVGRNPKLKIIQSTNTTELSVRFGRKAKALMDTPEYKEVFETRLNPDSQAAGKWETEQGGEYYAAGVGSAITGRGADLLIIDDPHTEQDAMNAQALERTYEWYTSGPRQRLQPGGTIIIVMTRWNEKDLTGRLIKAQKENKADQWEVIEFPAILPSDKPLWPEYWKLEDLEAVKASIPLSKWNAQYMHPTEDSGPCLILVDCLKGRYEFPELRRIALEQYGYWNPETVIIEGKASGLPLTYELRKMGIPVINFTPSKGNDKHTRVNSVSPLFESGKIYAPLDMDFAQEVIEECAAFPYGDHDDLVDSMTQAVMRFRQGGLIQHPDDYEDEPLQQKPKVYY